MTNCSSVAMHFRYDLIITTIDIYHGLPLTT